MVISLASRTFTSVFGSRNDRLVKAYRRRVAQVNALEDEIRQLTDAQLRAATADFQQQISSGTKVEQILPRILAVAREVMDRAVGIRNIFNPAHQFDPHRLPPALRETYAAVHRQMEQTPPAETLGQTELVPGWMQVEIPVELYDAVRALYPHSRPPFRARPFDVQLIGGMVLGEGNISEMKTGEGKTIVAPLACYVACIEKLQCAVVTVNDYLVQRDRDWVFPFYHWLGLTVGAIHPFHMQESEDKLKAYNCNVVYGTNSEFGFDYLRDNMKLSAREQVQKRRDFCIIDEVDSILIDEARTPLIISGPAHDDAPRYGLADGVARHLMQKQREWDAADAKVQQTLMRIKGLEGDVRNSREKSRAEQLRSEMKQLQDRLPELEAARDQHVQFYEVEREKKATHLTHDGVAEAQKVAGIGSFYVGNNMDFPHLLENALRAHVIYQRDKDYVVQNGEVIIVDEFTGRLMIGRQWSDGLHQAVEAKEKVKIKQETQTLATITIQNYFKLYKRLAGMTGTAITEATEFNEVYGLDVVCIPTNVPVVRADMNDIIYLSQKDKWDAIIEEIKRMHDVGRPVLVGTTSVEKSEMLAQLLARKHSIKHEVLNAKQHEREAQIVENAGELGAVMIATNMAGRGTDIKLRPIPRETLIHHWQVRDVLPREARPEMTDEQIIELAWRHMAHRQLGLKPAEAAAFDFAELRLKLLRHWVEQEGWKVNWPPLSAVEKATMYKYFVAPPWHDPQEIARMDEPQLRDVLDRVPNFLFHRLAIFKDTEELGGLHIVGTERHESRRIDNQLRGRAGRQGDRGSSRFFISLEDELMQLFAGPATLTALSKLGMKEGDAIEHRWLTRSVEKAQTKVEQRNFEIRKNLLEYDEVMEHQRSAFYGIRQEVLDGGDLQAVVFGYIERSIQDAVDEYLDRDYVRTQVAEWCRTTLDVSLDPSRLRIDSQSELYEVIRREAGNEARQTVNVSLGEYMSNEMPPEEWDLRGLAGWAMSRFKVDLKQNQLRQMNPGEVENLLVDAAIEQIDKQDLSGADKFLDPLYARQQLVAWAQAKFNIELDPAQINPQDVNAVTTELAEKARAAYQQREVTYPVTFVLEMVAAAAQHDLNWAAQQMAQWVNQRFGFNWTNEQVLEQTPQQMLDELSAENERWIRGGKLEEEVDRGLTAHSDSKELANWVRQRFGQELTPDELTGTDRRDVVLAAGRRFFRAEIAQLESFVLLQILDMAWKDHLYAMDQLKDSIGLRGYAERDPRIEYKREGSRLFAEMERIVRDRVTDLIFRARLTADFEARSVYGQQQARHDEAASLTDAAAQQAGQGTDDQQAALAAANRAGGDDDSHLTRKQRRARAARGEEDSDRAAQQQQQFRKRKRR